MRRVLLLVPFLFACAKAETPPVDSAAMATAAPAALTEADVAGTWSGVAMMMESDSVIARWTQVCATGTCRGISEGMKDTVTSTYHLMADSAMGTSEAYSDPAAGGARVIDAFTLRLKDGKVVGTGVLRPDGKPDSVLMRYRFEGSRKM